MKACTFNKKSNSILQKTSMKQTYICFNIYNFYKCKKNIEINYSGKNDIYKKELYIYLIYNK
ncbi:hypothetical protein PFBG_05303 [Plasmodium falciparum 7G8]|uniref:Uncharacterized protein n=1 Tax=Plasmodium falciparum (isolate 7G8) TaxID=57266 RepID=W7FEI4_PLAF8|nr:hypothetical protein PFBG_05303 [Plasmodium falciparum 7G8]